ncbi:MAG: helicase-exonuclease AddAB subunit AddA [Ruminococcaceae bacterium]|nr:helicase-exonuclease AddAB subunit AddA [Oscillospiraceae bacterium]
MAFNPTYEQDLAINAKGNVLVCAAAGSGKTAVLVERVIRMLTDSSHPVSADRLLIVTFTNAAAAEMRSRIEKRLYEETLKNPFDLALKKQKYLISSAKICTIDSFCIDLVRSNFDKLGINPDFKISTAENLEAISNRIVNSVILEQMENGGREFYSLLELTGCEYDESRLATAIRSIFNYSQVTPFPQKFLEILTLGYQTEFSKGNICFDRAISIALEKTENINGMILAGLDASKQLGEEAEKLQAYFDAFCEISDKLLMTVQNGDWNTIRKAFTDFIMPPIPRIQKFKSLPEITLMREIREAVLSERDALLNIFLAEREEIERKNREIYPAVKLLVELVCRYKDELFKAQLEENSLTFYNTEQLALELLCHSDSDGNIVINDGAEEIFSQFDEVLVDEYQDVNDLQNMLFYVLSNREHKLFAVGDVKQSIYGFRGANPNNFLNKKNRYKPINMADENESKKVILANNFRSRAEVCDYINFFFENIMTEENGDIVYDSEERLVASNKQFSTVDLPLNRLCVVDKLSNSEDDRLTVEADVIAMQIRKIMSSGECIHTKDGGLRKAEYSDFAILLRATDKTAAKLSAELEAEGIPVNCANDSFIELLEVDTFLSLLKIIDNPADDIALLTVLMSPIFEFTAEELANIRAEHKNGDLIAAISLFRDKNSKVAKFYKALELYRAEASVLPLKNFVFKLINITGYGDIVSAMSDGMRRKANLLRLAEYAASYSDAYGNSISGFVNYIKNVAGSKLSSAKVTSGSDSVQIMSIHASKGLQFPVCILANIDSKINMRDSSDSMLFSENIGIGFRYFDEQQKNRVDSIERVLISEEMRIKTLEEELRLLYVAMTRAEDMLIMVGAYKNLQKKLGELSAKLISEGGRIGKRSYGSVSSIGDWILMTSLIHKDGKKLRVYADVSPTLAESDSNIEIEIIAANGIEKNPLSKAEVETFEPDDFIKEQILSNMQYKYPYEALKDIEAKCSASMLNNKAEGDKYAFSSRPSFMEDDGITGADRGTAMHKIMQFIDFEATDVGEEIERLKEWEYISELEANAVDKAAIERFFSSDVFSRARNSKYCRREMRFLTEVSAGSIDSTLKSPLCEEKIIVQGAVDLCFLEDDGVVILDFKSDRVDNPEALKAAYSEQLNIYEKAVEKIFLKPVKEKIIYSFSLGSEIKI